MSDKKLGDKEAQVRALRIKRAEQPIADKRRAKAERALGPRAIEELRAVEKAIKAKTPKEGKLKTPKKKTPEQRLRDGRKQIAAAKKARKAAKRGRAAGPSKSPIVNAEAAITKPGAPVPALKVAEFIARPSGATMAELVAEFGIEAHPMRAKIHYVRQLDGWDVEHDGERYTATTPKGYVFAHYPAHAPA